MCLLLGSRGRHSIPSVAAVVHVGLQRVTIEMDHFDQGTPNTRLGVGRTYFSGLYVCGVIYVELDLL